MTGAWSSFFSCTRTTTASGLIPWDLRLKGLKRRYAFYKLSTGTLQELVEQTRSREKAVWLTEDALVIAFCREWETPSTWYRYTVDLNGATLLVLARTHEAAKTALQRLLQLPLGFYKRQVVTLSGPLNLNRASAFPIEASIFHEIVIRTASLLEYRFERFVFDIAQAPVLIQQDSVHLRQCYFLPGAGSTFCDALRKRTQKNAVRLSSVYLDGLPFAHEEEHCKFLRILKERRIVDKLVYSDRCRKQSVEEGSLLATARVKSLQVCVASMPVNSAKAYTMNITNTGPWSLHLRYSAQSDGSIEALCSLLSLETKVTHLTFTPVKEGVCVIFSEWNAVCRQLEQCSHLHSLKVHMDLTMRPEEAERIFEATAHMLLNHTNLHVVNLNFRLPHQQNTPELRMKRTRTLHDVVCDNPKIGVIRFYSSLYDIGYWEQHIQPVLETNRLLFHLHRKGHKLRGTPAALLLLEGHRKPTVLFRLLQCHADNLLGL